MCFDCLDQLLTALIYRVWSIVTRGLLRYACKHGFIPEGLPRDRLPITTDPNSLEVEVVGARLISMGKQAGILTIISATIGMSSVI